MGHQCLLIKCCHYFAGYSGGMKALMPGVSTGDAIKANHRNMVRDNAATWRIHLNSVRDDIDEGYSYCPVDFIVNVVLDGKNNILKAFSRHVVHAHR